MTGFYISVGYQCDHSRESVWEELKKIVTELRMQTSAIAEEMTRVEGGSIQQGMEYAAQFRGDPGDLTLQIVDTPDPLTGEERRYISMLASGGSPSRELKEKSRRAFCRLVTKEMHQKGMNINIKVA